MLVLAVEYEATDVGLRMLNLGCGDVDTSTTIGAMVFTMMATLAQAERDIRSERVGEFMGRRRAASRDLDGGR
jgi:DNA invertase Pin-like site-specific DNA recombinase